MVNQRGHMVANTQDRGTGRCVRVNRRGASRPKVLDAYGFRPIWMRNSWAVLNREDHGYF
jgi:hypothetical protein